MTAIYDTMTPRQLVRELDRRGLLGSPVRLCGGRTWGADATGWYYSFGRSLDCIADAVRSVGCGYNLRGSAADNVCGPFRTKREALAELNEFAVDDDGRQFIEEKLLRDDAEREQAIHAADALCKSRRLRRKVKRASNIANRLSRAGNPGSAMD